MRYVGTLEQSNYRVVRFDDLNDCINKIKEGSIHTCIAFPDNFVIGNENDLDITFYVDYSRLNLVYLVIGELSSGVQEESTELTTQYTAVLLEKISSTKSSIDSIMKDVISIKDANTENIDSVSTLKKTVDSIDLSSKKVNMSGISSDVQELYDYAEDIQKEGMDAVDEGYSFIKDARGHVNQSLINDFEDELENINESLTNLLNSSSEHLELTLESISSTREAVDEINDKLESAKTKKTQIRSNLNTLADSMGSLSKGVLNVKSALESIIDDLNSIEITSAEKIAKPVNSKIEPVIAENTKLSYLFPSFLVLIIMFIGILLSSTLVITEKNSKAFFRVNTTPTSDILFLVATYVTTLLILLAQTIVVLACAFYFLKTPIFDNALLTSCVIFLTITLFSFLGMLIGYIFSKQEATAMVSISLSAVLLFLSNLVLPLESMSISVQKIAFYNPYVMLSDLARKSFLFGGTFESLQNPLLIIVGACVVLFVLSYLTQHLSKMKYFNRIPHIKRKTEISMPDDHHFTVGGHKIKNEFELLKLIESMSETQFYNFMEKYRKELIEWAKTKRSDKKLARKFKKSKLTLVEYLEKKCKKKLNGKK
jgi:ABC-type multidrug transport system permease subunit